MLAEQWAQDLVEQKSFAGALHAVHDPCGAHLASGLHDGREPVDEVIEGLLITAQSVLDDLPGHWGHGLGCLADVQHERRGLEAVDDVLLGIDTRQALRIEDHVPFRDEVANRHTVLLAEVAQLGFVARHVDVEDVAGGVIGAAPVDACLAVTEGQEGEPVGSCALRCARVGELGPVVGQQFLGEVGRLALEVEDVFGLVLGVIVGPGIAAVEVEVDEATFLLDLGDRRFTGLS